MYGAPKPYFTFLLLGMSVTKTDKTRHSTKYISCKELLKI
jgi:hypothetical protein